MGLTCHRTRGYESSNLVEIQTLKVPQKEGCCAIWTIKSLDGFLYILGFRFKLETLTHAMGFYIYLGFCFIIKMYTN
jgi:hypothetical protein